MTEVKKEPITQSLVNKLNTQFSKGQICSGCIWDTKDTCFGIRFGKTGASYVYKYRNKCGKSQTKTFGKIKDMTVAEAKDLLNEFKPTIKITDPFAKKYNTKFTIKDLCEKYLAEHDMRDSTRKEDASRINRLVLPLVGNIPLFLVTAEDMMDLQKSIATGDKHILINGMKDPNNKHSYTKVTGGNGAAKRTMEMMKTILNFAEAKGLIEKNPMNTKRFTKIEYAKKETAFLEPDEYKNLGYVLRKYELSKDGSDQQCVTFIKLAALTGCRKGELLNLTWDRVNFDQQYFLFAQTKTTDGPQRRTFGSAVKRLLEEMRDNTTSVYLFPSIKKANVHRKDCLKALNQICKITDAQGNQVMNNNAAVSKLTLHALRHSFATRCNDLDFSDVQIEGLLGHKKGDVEGIYAHNRSAKLVARANEVSEDINNLLKEGMQKAEKEYVEGLLK